MFKKLLLISVLCMGLLGLTMTGAGAWPLPTFVGWPQATWGSINIDSILKKVNVSNDPVRIELQLVIEQIQFQCCNGGDQCGGIGNPFDLDALVQDMELINASDVDKNGILYYNNLVSNEAIYNAVLPFLPEDVCQNDNWYINPDTLIVNRFWLRLAVFTNDKTGREVMADEVCGTYILEPGQAQYTLVEEECP